MIDVEAMYVQHAVVTLSHEPTVNLSCGQILRRHVFNRASRSGHRGVNAYISSSSRPILLRIEAGTTGRTSRHRQRRPVQRLYADAVTLPNMPASGASCLPPLRATPTTRAQKTHPTKERIFVAFWEGTRRKHENKGSVAERVDLPLDLNILPPPRTKTAACTRSSKTTKTTTTESSTQPHQQAYFTQLYIRRKRGKSPKKNAHTRLCKIQETKISAALHFS